MKEKDAAVQTAIDSTNVVETQEVNQTNDEPKTPLEMVQKIVSLADKGFQLTFDEEKNEDFNYEDKQMEKINILFSDILKEGSSELLPAVKTLTDFKTLTDELKNAGNILAKIIGYIDEGFTLTDVSDEQQPFDKLHDIFAGMLMLSDTGLRMHIPTPVSVES